MSFSGDIKRELSRAAVQKSCCARAELCGMLLFASSFNKSGVRIQTGNALLLKRIDGLCEKALGCLPDWRSSSSGGRTVITLSGEDDMRRLFALLGYEFRAQVALHLNAQITEEDCCRAAFLRGAFLTGGYAADPEKDYALELTTSHAALSREVYALLCDMDMRPKTVRRQSTNVVYFKGSEAIEEFLTLTGAPRAAMDIMEAKVIKEVRNTINRKVNCETANLLRTVDTGNDQLDAIKALRAAGMLETLPDRLREAAVLREANPDLSLAELAGKANPPVSKSGLNHRLRKLMSVYDEMRGEEK